MIKSAAEAKAIQKEHGKCGCEDCYEAMGYLAALKGPEVTALGEAARNAEECFNRDCHNNCRALLLKALAAFDKLVKP